MSNSNNETATDNATPVTAVRQQPTAATIIEEQKKQSIAKATRKPITKPVPMIGLYNKTGYNIHVVFKDCDIVIPPKGRTTKIYYQADIVSVQDTTLQQALIKGIIAIIR